VTARATGQQSLKNISDRDIPEEDQGIFSGYTIPGVQCGPTFFRNDYKGTQRIFQKPVSSPSPVPGLREFRYRKHDRW
jgi:hypothetical protein